VAFRNRASRKDRRGSYSRLIRLAEGEHAMLDVILIAVGCGCFAVAIAYAYACDRL
jgi:hypothetical protein